MKATCLFVVVVALLGSHSQLDPQFIARLDDWPIGLTWSPDGDVLYTSLDEGLFAVDVTTGDVVQLYQAEQMGLFDLDPDRRFAFFDGIADNSISHDADLVVLPTELPAPPSMRVNVQQALNTNRVRWSPDGTRIATTTQYGQVYDAATGERLIQIPPLIDEQQGPHVRALDWLDDNHLVLVMTDGVPYVYSVIQEAYIRQVTLPSGVYGRLPLSPNRRMMVTSETYASEVFVLDTTTWQLSATLQIQPEVPIVFTCFVGWLPSGRGFILTPSPTGVIMLCGLDAETCEAVWEGETTVNNAPAIHPDGQQLAFAARRDIYLLDLTDALAELGLDVAD